MTVLPELVETALVPLQNIGVGGSTSSAAATTVTTTAPLVPGIGAATPASSVSSFLTPAPAVTSTTLAVSQPLTPTPAPVPVSASYLAPPVAPTASPAQTVAGNTVGSLSSTQAPAPALVPTPIVTALPTTFEINSRRLQEPSSSDGEQLLSAGVATGGASTAPASIEIDGDAFTQLDDNATMATVANAEGQEGEMKAELSRDAGLLIGFAVLAFMVSVLLASLLASHFPLACANLTTIEENYENMPNPFDHGSSVKNLSQIMGQFGADWFLPVLPRRALSDGVSYPRPGEPVLPVDGFKPEEIWKFRYVAIPAQQPETEQAPLSTGFFQRIFGGR